MIVVRQDDFSRICAEPNMRSNMRPCYIPLFSSVSNPDHRSSRPPFSGPTDTTMSTGPPAAVTHKVTAAGYALS
jgi:hypothetical protein